MRIPPREARSRKSLVERILNLAREHLGMDVAVLAEFSAGFEVFRWIDGDGDSFDFRRDAAFLFQDHYARRVLESPPLGLVRDARADRRVKDLLVTRVADVGAYLGVPVRFPDGRVYGSLFCVSHSPQPSLDERDVTFLNVLALLIGEDLERREAEAEARIQRFERIRRVLEEGEILRFAFQPIYELGSGAMVGVEALARFEAPPKRSPDRWFAEAIEVGLGVELEMAALRAALVHIEELPGALFLAVNISPEALTSSGFLQTIDGAECGRLVLEVTEHAQVDDYEALGRVVSTLRERGIRLAIDDVGAGFASLRHVLRLMPDVIKLDLTLTHQIDSDPIRRALASSFITFANETRTTITAEGIETRGEVEALRSLGVSCGQGYFLARPAALRDLPSTVAPMRRVG